MWGAKRQQALNLIYRLFRDSGGIHPTIGDLQQAFDDQGDGDVDAARVVQRIPAKFLKPLSSSPDYPRPDERLMLTAEGISRAAGSSTDMGNYVASVQWLARRADRRGRSGEQSGHGMQFTTRQLAEVVPLSLDSDRRAFNRLIAILEAEGWLLDDDNTSAER
jgi:hypothetical protein